MSDQTTTDTPAVVPARVGVLGGGRMGAGIAHAFLLAGSRVDVVERDRASAEAAADRIRQSVVRSVERRATSRSAAEVDAALSVGTDLDVFAAAELVIEAVPEDRALKEDALARIERTLPAASALASNTSSISIDALGAALRRPDRLLGLHFFNPVPTSALVEVVLGSATAPALADAARGWVAAIGKTAVTVRDSPGFASSRLGVMLGLEAIRMLEEGVASAADIDTAMELGYRHPMGPLRTTDIVGLDVRLGIAEELEAAFGERFAPPALLRRLVAEGHLGRKSGSGFYEWSE
ncbi:MULTISPECIES: 3-hydroxyacyl-CoA dehydrogenase family protein [unclassified Microbacterium]|uniref:3-hydroxyacyl-CoA dehydrogenase family protein n=1 Tax=unclassified Microbacterium TaxID=2609290 RepID=UPI00097C6332|nr:MULTISPECIES: 3-hydroxyacyl-CoA dehydrogenase family protein [unclassified Microbacterium]MDI9892840.1 3-hydroxyacyl-CoA dehydrogenase family protein [Microbacterium sp. IEGM 1404]MXS74613.1 3-hydroxyacyl-CoA dehydrogenase family protein [Microbacterium sp. TL13]ONI63200.1 3-hydroxybutyryl-CoA dehydrogenase [Microbacterium sp. CSI-V]